MPAMVGMKERPRVYDRILEAHLSENRQMAFVSGPRQVGKTTTCRHEGSAYLNWDILEDQRKIVLGPQHAFQVVLNLPYEEIDCFDFRAPVVVPARTFLSQLM
jgi:hypothetical protein